MKLTVQRVVSLMMAVFAVSALALLGTVFALRRLFLATRPAMRQQRLLSNILRQNATSEYGRANGFGGDSTSVRMFLEQHPISDYEGVRNWIERSLLSNRNLLAEVDLFRVSTTSGTTGQPKVILQSRLLYRREYLEYTIAVLYRILLADPRSLLRPLGIIAAAGEHKRMGVVESASAANTLYRTSPFRRFAALPPSLFEIENAGARYYYYTLFITVCRCRCLITPNPTTVLEVLDVATRHREILREDLQNNKLVNRFNLPDTTWSQIQAAMDDLGTAPLSECDPLGDIRTIVTWTGGSCGVFARRLSERIPHSQVLELGYLATDSPICVPVGIHRQVLATDSVFAEFLPLDGDGKPRRYDELEQDKLYEIVLTNRYGLYRYAIRDVVKANGRIFGSPCIEFVRKTVGFSNITGEKLSEDQVCTAIAECEEKLGVSVEFFVVMPNLDSRGYEVFCEVTPPACFSFESVFSQSFDNALCEINIEYRTKRHDGRLRPACVVLLVSGAGQRYKSVMLARGARDIQFKVRHLQSDGDNRELLASMTP